VGTFVGVRAVEGKGLQRTRTLSPERDANSRRLNTGYQKDRPLVGNVGKLTTPKDEPGEGRGFNGIVNSSLPETRQGGSADGEGTEITGLFYAGSSELKIVKRPGGEQSLNWTER